MLSEEIYFFPVIKQKKGNGFNESNNKNSLLPQINANLTLYINAKS